VVCRDRWADGVLDNSRVTGDGALDRQFSLAPGGRELTLVLTVTSDRLRGPVRVRYLYRR